MRTDRPSWSDYFMSIAHAAARRSTCDRKHVGCVLVIENRIIATGYNGSAPGAEHCGDVGHDMHDGHCVRTIHAESNAILQAARHGVSTRGALAYVNTYPCLRCLQSLVGAGIISVVFDDEYRKDPRVQALADHLGVVMTRVKVAP